MASSPSLKSLWARSLESHHVCLLVLKLKASEWKVSELILGISDFLRPRCVLLVGCCPDHGNTMHLKLIDASTGSILESLSMRSGIDGMVCSGPVPFISAVVAVYDDAENAYVGVLDLLTGKIMTRIFVRGDDVQLDLLGSNADSVAYSPDGRTVAVYCCKCNRHDDGVLLLIDTASSIVTSHPLQCKGTLCLAFAPTCESVVLGYQDGRVHVLNLATRDERFIGRISNTAKCVCLACQPFGHMVVVGCSDSSIHFTDMAGIDHFSKIDLDNHYEVGHITWSADGQLVVVACTIKEECQAHGIIYTIKAGSSQIQERIHPESRVDFLGLLPFDNAWNQGPMFLPDCFEDLSDEPEEVWKTLRPWVASNPNSQRCLYCLMCDKWMAPCPEAHEHSIRHEWRMQYLKNHVAYLAEQKERWGLWYSNWPLWCRKENGEATHSKQQNEEEHELAEIEYQFEAIQLPTSSLCADEWKGWVQEGGELRFKCLLCDTEIENNGNTHHERNGGTSYHQKQMWYFEHGRWDSVYWQWFLPWKLLHAWRQCLAMKECRMRS